MYPKFPRILIIFGVVILCNIATCNDRNKQERIIDGTSTDIQTYPFIVSIEYKGYHYCAGSIIRKNVIISAHHCFLSSNLTQLYRIRAGSSNKGSGGHLYSISKVILHPGFNKQTVDYDVALIRLTKSLVYTSYIKQIPLPTDDEYLEPSNITTVIGWGRTKTSKNNNILRKKNLIVVSDSVCKDIYRKHLVLTPRHLCAGIQGPCLGDSGGPLVYNNKLHGIVSFKLINCINFKFPLVFTRITAVRDWINETIDILIM